MVRLMLLDAVQGTKLREYLSVIDTQVDRQTRMISNLLDLTRLEAGRYELTPEDVDVAQVVQSLARGLRPLAEENGLRLHEQCHRLPPRIRTDTGAVEQILLNLVGNAIKFTEKGDISVTGERLPEGILITVQDTGIGMAPTQLTHLFSKFYTARNPHKRGEGTGLGLAISQMLATALGGKITVTSQKGRGSSFVLHLPLEMPARLAPRAVEPEQA
jgi:signal transduction histidine kinase